jgi:Glycine zipper 2TM domain
MAAQLTLSSRQDPIMHSMTMPKTPAASTARIARLLAGGALALLAGCAAEPMQVPEPPPPTVAPLPDTRVYVYPNAGQSPAQLDRDRYECHEWAVQQSGFDPSVAQAAPHQRVEVVAMPPPGTSTVAGAATGALLGAAVSRPRDAGGGAVLGAVAGALIGAASDANRAQQAATAQRRINAANERRDYSLDQLAVNYRRAIGACLLGRGYTVN